MVSLPSRSLYLRQRTPVPKVQKTGCASYPNRALGKIIKFLHPTGSEVRILRSLPNNIVAIDTRVQQEATLVICFMLDHVTV
jgi:hypothetical protein